MEKNATRSAAAAITQNRSKMAKNMKTVMCYGDSLTWGYNPKTRDRYPFHRRWPGVFSSKIDGIHLDEPEQEKLGLNVKKMIVTIFKGFE